jgi:uncharacterized protein (DUF362 family)
MSKVYLVSTDNRAAGARRCLGYIGARDWSGKSVYVKPNFNTADPAPGSTHNDTLDALLEFVAAARPREITLGERSGPAEAAQVFAQRGIPALCEKYGAKLLNLETMPQSGWARIERSDLHWGGGYFEVPQALLDADIVVGTCCLKTHAYGGVYSNALKLAVGLTPKDMGKLHTPDIRRQIAEINLAYTPEFILSDAVEVFTDGGPMEGTRKNADIMLIASDRVALDAVGLAVLKSLGSNSAITDTPIFAQEQIVRAVELGLGVSSASEIEIVTDDEASAAAASRIKEILLKG